jgi:hypothetical protein
MMQHDHATRAAPAAWLWDLHPAEVLALLAGIAIVLRLF